MILVLSIIHSTLPVSESFTPNAPFRTWSSSSSSTITSTTSSTTVIRRHHGEPGGVSPLYNKKKKKGRFGGGSASKVFAGALKKLRKAAFRYSGSVTPGVQTPQRVVDDATVKAKPDYALDGVPLATWIEVKSPDEKLRKAAFRYSGSVTPGVQTPQRVVEDATVKAKPDYALDGVPRPPPLQAPRIIEVKSPDEIVKMRAAGRVAREVLDAAGRLVRPGVTTDAIDALVHAEALKRGAYPSPLNYRGFPKSCCTSVNEVICHGIPDDRPLQDGDLINIDVTCYLDGYHGDCSEMYCVGTPSEANKRLLQTTYDCWVKAMNIVRPNRDYKDIGGIIEEHVTERGYTTVKEFLGHGIGSVFHTNPNIFHYKNSEPCGQMAPGHTFTIEPMICEGTSKVLNWPDEWTATTMDGKNTCQFEHTLLITPDGVEALTGKLPSSPVQFWELESQEHDGVWLGTSAWAKQQMKEYGEAL